MDAILKQHGHLLISSPFAWNQDICDADEWLESETLSAFDLLKHILTSQAIPEMQLNYTITQQIEHLDWQLPQTERLKHVYSVGVLLAQKG